MSIRSPKISIRGDAFKNVSLSGLSLGLSINDVPTIMANPVPVRNEDKIAVRIGSEDLAKYYGDLQRSKSTATLSADTEIEVDDDVNGVVTIPCVFISPATSMTTSSYSIILNLAGSVAGLDVLRSDIYESPTFAKFFGSSPTDKQSADLASLIGKLKAPSEFMLTLFNEMERQWVLSTQDGQTNSQFREEDAAIVRRIRQNNDLPTQILRSILSASHESSMSSAMQKLADASPLLRIPFHQAIAKSIVDILSVQGGGFLSVLYRLCALFDLYAVPTLDPPYMRLVSIDTMLSNETAEEREVSMTEFVPKLGRSTTQPVTAVTVRSVMSAEYKSSIEGGLKTFNNNGRIVGLYPTDALSTTSPGFPMDTPLPAWIPPTISSGSNLLNIIKRSLEGKRPSAATVIDEANKALNNASDLTSAILQEIARARYRDAALQADSVSATCPLDFTWKVGTRYKITADADGEKQALFNGTVSAITHQISRPQLGGAGICQTSISFSHVEMGDYSLE